jgi:U3 small nucleolar ribonucleoprotein protein IMP4
MITYHSGISPVKNHHLIIYRHHTYAKDGKDSELKELGPRFEMRPFQIKLGTVDMKEAENEWVLRPYMNSATRKTYLS